MLSILQSTNSLIFRDYINNVIHLHTGKRRQSPRCPEPEDRFLPMQASLVSLTRSQVMYALINLDY